MIQIPTHLSRQFAIFIDHKGVPAPEQSYYVKWLRFYLDFCNKYNYRQKADKSLSAFMEKLKEKRKRGDFQSRNQRVGADGG